MAYENYIILSSVFLIISFGIYILPKILKLFKTKVVVLYVGTFIAVVIAFIPDCKECGILETIFLSLYKALNVFAINADFSEIVEELENIKSVSNIGAIRTYLAFLELFAPLMTVGAFLEIIAEFVDIFKFYLRRFNETTYIFSDLNDRTYEYAKSIIKNHKKIINESYSIVFTNVVKDDDEYMYNMRKKAKKINAMCLKTSVKDIKISKRKGKNKKMFFYFWSENENNNIKEAIHISEKLEKAKMQVTLNIHSTKEEAEIVVDSLNRKYIDKKNININRNNEYAATIQDLLYKRPLFVGSKNNKISVLIVGTGYVGEEALKNSLMCGQLFDFELEITVVSKNVDSFKSRMHLTMPEIMERDDLYHINFYEMDVANKDLRELVKKHSDINYTIISLGNDSLNVETAVKLRTLFTRNHIEEGNKVVHGKIAIPVINVFIDDATRTNRVENLENISGEKYNINTFGIITKQGDMTLSDPKYEMMAKNVHCVYWKEEDFDKPSEICEKTFKYEYNRRSCNASSIHSIYKIYYCFKDEYPTEYFINKGPTDFYKKNRDLILRYDSMVNNENGSQYSFAGKTYGDKDLLLKLGITEHRRWCTYNRINGYVRASDDMLKEYFYVFDERNGNELNGIVCNQMAKLHPCLVDWDIDSEKEYDNGECDALDHVTKLINTLIEAHNLDMDKKEFKEYDYRMVKNIAKIYDIEQNTVFRGIARADIPSPEVQERNEEHNRD